MYDTYGNYLKLNEYNSDLTDKYNDRFTIMKMIYKDEVLWERPIEKKRMEMQFVECMKKFNKNDDKYYVQCELWNEIFTYEDDSWLIATDDKPMSAKEIANGKWYLCEKIGRAHV